MGKLHAKAMGSGGGGGAVERARAAGSCRHFAAARPPFRGACPCCRAARHPSPCRLSRAAAWGIGSGTSGCFSWGCEGLPHEAVRPAPCCVAWAAANLCCCGARRKTNQNLMRMCLIRSWIPTRSRGGLCSPCRAAQTRLRCQLSQAAAALALPAPTALATLMPPCSRRMPAASKTSAPGHHTAQRPKWLYLSPGLQAWSCHEWAVNLVFGTPAFVPLHLIHLPSIDVQDTQMKRCPV